MHQKICHALCLRLTRIIGDGLRIEGRDIHVEAAAGMDHIAHDQSDEQRDGRDDFEIKQRHAADPPDFLQVLHAGDSGDHRAEDDQE